MTEYECVSEKLPPKGTRVLTLFVVDGDDYSWSPARLTNYGWRDDHSKPVRVTHWKHVVAPAEIA
jgi:hypothetical protein